MFRYLKLTEIYLDAIIQRGAFLVLAGMIAVITLQIISRVFFTAVSWSEELARYLLIWLSFLGATMAWQRGRHIVVTFFVAVLPAHIQKAVQAAALAVAMVFFAVIVYYGVRFMQIQAFQVSPSLRIPIRYIFGIVPLSAAIMLFYTLLDGIELFSESARRQAALLQSANASGKSP